MCWMPFWEKGHSAAGRWIPCSSWSMNNLRLCGDRQSVWRGPWCAGSVLVGSFAECCRCCVVSTWLFACVHQSSMDSNQSAFIGDWSYCLTSCYRLIHLSISGRTSVTFCQLMIDGIPGGNLGRISGIGLGRSLVGLVAAVCWKVGSIVWL